MVANKVTHAINCAGRQVPNHWEPIGVKYLTYFWLDQETQVSLYLCQQRVGRPRSQGPGC